ncbi:anti-phage dCTP deaminase [Brevifollis gellanilyticus]|uniref:Deoxycytidylate deaminase n=1 Tax=Brevifollis gellanilyticus TaxID=748831 RepID=A0A512MET9_9BACT|nr:anti-phage dCTP deaminase [Brevifollis gellanilyticus]GEP45243.1 deoxycytidylate deaminase [Brevifollis gellanilyticus]
MDAVDSTTVAAAPPPLGETSISGKDAKAATSTFEQTKKSEGAEIVFGLLGAVGTDLEKVSKYLQQSLKAVQYDSYPLHLIDPVVQFERWKDCPLEPLDKRVSALMTAGTEFRQSIDRNDAIALLAVTQIRESRKQLDGTPKTIVNNKAFILRSLKTPEEIAKLREVYGKSFFVIAASASKEQRERRFAHRIAKSYNLSQAKAEHVASAVKLVERDEQEAEGVKGGQNLREAFPLADFFVDASADDSSTKRSIDRLIELIFGNFRHTPLRDEIGMLHAFAAGIRSASLARQVGAAILTDDGDLISTGCNDVPTAGGGLYWDGDDGDDRDHVREEDSNDMIKKQVLADLLKCLKNEGWLTNDKSVLSEKELLKIALSKSSQIRKSQLMDITEYGRAVHAEMAAITDAAKRGIALKGAVLYSTTFPCHNCAKHIVASGINRVVYVEPYPKSFAKFLHSDSIEVDSTKGSEKRVRFDPFIGVSSRQCFDLFSMDKPRKSDGTAVQWIAQGRLPKISEDPLAYLQREETNAVLLDSIIQSKLLKTI